MAAIISAEMIVKYSTKSGSAGNTTAGTANGSLGQYVSTTEWPGGDLSLFDAISGAENAASTVDYRCLFLHNTNTSNALVNAIVYLAGEVAGGADIAVAADPTAASAPGSSSAQALSAPTETAPGTSVTSLSYASPTTAAAGVSLGTIPAGQVKAFWVRRTATNSAALSGDGVTLGWGGDTGSN